MPSTHTINPAAGNPVGGGPPTRPERLALLRALPLGRGLERILPRFAAGSPTSADPDAVLTAIAAAAGLESEDRLVTAHNLLCAHLAVGADPAEIARRRLGHPGSESGPLGGVGPQSAAPVALGVAFALQRTGEHRCAVALVERRWAETEECRAALAIAREHSLPLVLVAIDSATVVDHTTPAVDRNDFEGVRAAVKASIAAAHADLGASLVIASSLARPEPEGRRPLFRTDPGDPLVAYERRLLINGFSRTDLTAVHRKAARELDAALTGQVAKGTGRR